MNVQTLICPLCGFEYEPERHTACDACPLHHNCLMTCCPVCGYNSVDPGRSKLAQFATRLFFGDRLEKKNPADFDEHGSIH